ncbi:MAG: hypothetical protein HY858_03135 [Candidatus Solibacter usitatus]|nr:hypothetical protein [Candidatus Solibacter usitatus]
MAEVKIRNIPDWLCEWHRKRAEAQGASLEEYLRLLLADTYRAKRADVAAECRTLRSDIKKRHGVLSDSTPIIGKNRAALGRP